MTKFIVDLYFDGYDSEAEMAKACKEYIEEALNFSASSVYVSELKDLEKICTNVCDTEAERYLKARLETLDFSEKNILAASESACNILKFKLQKQIKCFGDQ